MKNMRLYFLLTMIFSSSSFYAAQSACPKNCDQPLTGPPCIAGTPGINGSSAFGSFYNTAPTVIPIGASIPFPLVSSQENIGHPSATDFVIQEDGYYYIYYGAAYSLSGDDDSSTILAIYVNGTQIPGSKLGIIFPFQVNEPVKSIGCIVPLHAGDLVNIRNIDSILNLSVGLTGPVNSFINIIRIAHL